ncbi:acyl-CoA N-acyltransferase [Aspergillus leporis]|jgi:GNAT superfamily N-acetyltransferase|uniref:Acyl-CoA N-acyltransferase n=1 Tax=Aspergillus leporis TaxID=41062 RepID=A0A5N5X5C8_9EURO|nr:acyl-CoA N-acyltransferase [Aspergillus leporis]
MIDLRNIGPDKWEIWKHLRLAALIEAPYAFGSKLAEWRNAPEKQWRDRLCIPGAYQVIAFLHGTAVGMAGGLRTDKPEIAELVSMWVVPAVRGRGIGDALIAAVEEWAQGIGATRLRLEVVEDNNPALNLYLRNGFIEVELESDGQEQISVYRERVLLKDLRRG